MLRGPKKSPYEGGIFLLNLTFPNDYPHIAPILSFDTNIYHPNVSNTGDMDQFNDAMA